MSQTKAKAVKDRLKLAVNRAYETVAKAIFGLDPHHAHDAAIQSRLIQRLPVRSESV
jgi:monomeric isocitrate dehydrogenase